MKQKYIVIVCCAILAFASVHVVAQNNATNVVEWTSDSLSTDVQVAFRAIDQKNLLGGVSVIDMTDLAKKSYALGSLDYLETVVGGFGNNSVWGMTSGEYLVLVDGFPRDANNVLPSEIEQITVLKGAAAIALYGPRAVKGVIQITTKRGKEGTRMISIRANTGMHTPKVYPKYLGSAEYMALYNEARLNDGLTTLYSAEDIYNYGSGINPYRYPNLDFYSSDYLKKTYNRSDFITEITGGGERARFYTTAGYSNERGILKVGDADKNNIGRFFVRGNVDLSLHELISANVDANATFYDSRTANGNFWAGSSTLRPNRVAPLIPLSYIEPNDATSLALINASNYVIDGQYFLGGTQQDPTNAIAGAYAAGYSKYISRQFQFNTGLNFNLRDVLDGLFFRAKYGVDYAGTYNQAFNSAYATYAPTWTNYGGQDMIASITKYGEDTKTGNQEISNSTYRNTQFFSGQFDYAKSIDQEHNIFAMVLANGWQRQTSGQYHRMTNVNLGLQLSYNYRQKYYADFSAAIPYSAKLPSGNRVAFSPTGTLGWRLTKESFLENSSIFDDLVLTISGGVINSDYDVRIVEGTTTTEYYLYKSVLQSGGWWSWGDLEGESATEYQRSNNPDLTYVKRKEISVGLRGSLLNKLITFDANYFTNKMDGIVARPNNQYPSYFIQTGYPTSSIIPAQNYNIDDRSGVDFSVYFNQSVGEVAFRLGVSGIYYTSTVKRRDENYEYDYQTRMGRSLDGIWGLENIGFFGDQGDIDNSPTQQFGTVKPGDIKYKDQNGDGVIDSNDEVFLARASSPMVLGLNLTVKWKGFSLFAMGTGYFGGHGLKRDDTDTNVNYNYYWTGRSDRKYSELVRDRWTEDTKNTATYPRLTTASGDNSFRNSDFWLYSTNRFNLSLVQLTYDFPERIVKGNVVKELSVYLGGYNLLMISKERKHLEMNVGKAPQTRFYNLGVKAVF